MLRSGKANKKVQERDKLNEKKTKEYAINQISHKEKVLLSEIMLIQKLIISR